MRRCRWERHRFIMRQLESTGGDRCRNCGKNIARYTTHYATNRNLLPPLSKNKKWKTKEGEVEKSRLEQSDHTF